jgi:hypothetical protein
MTHETIERDEFAKVVGLPPSNEKNIQKPEQT